MFGNLRAFVKGLDKSLSPDGALVGSREVEVAVVALLLEVAYADGAVHPEEVRKIVDLLSQHFDHAPSSSELQELLDLGLDLDRDREKLKVLLDKVNSEFNASQKQLILVSIWRLAASDGSVSQLELQYATQLRQRLGLSLEQSLEARELSEVED